MEQPRPATADELAGFNRNRYGGPAIPWERYADGQWWLVHDDPDPDLARRSVGRIKVGSQRWAKRHGYVRHMRRQAGGRQIWVRFERETT